MNNSIGLIRFNLVAFFICSLLTISFGQSPYQLERKKELSISGVGAGTLGMGLYLRGQTPLYTRGELESLTKSSIGKFEKIALDNYSISAHNASNVFFYGSYSLPLLFLADKTTRKDMGTITAMWGEVQLLNSGLTVLSKYSFRRTRPFVYNPAVPVDDKLTSNARSSFFSGHTSTVAANTFFMAKTFSDYYPESKWKPVVWGTAITLPAVTGYLRVRSGKHFPTDVIVGYAIGAAVGYLVPHFHKRKRKGSKKDILSFSY